MFVKVVNALITHLNGNNWSLFYLVNLGINVLYLLYLAMIVIVTGTDPSGKPGATSFIFILLTDWVALSGTNLRIRTSPTCPLAW